jgi:hypothetical protein
MVKTKNHREEKEGCLKIETYEIIIKLSGGASWKTLKECIKRL